MAWILASIPFWVSGFVFSLYAPLACYKYRKPHETDGEVAAQGCVAFIAGVVLLLIAVWMCS